MAKFSDLKVTYDIDKNRLGKGSFGSVYKGTNKKNPNSQLAVKAIDKKKLTIAEINEIHNEVKLIQKCDHANIVNYYETYDDQCYIYLCMELCTGGELIDNFAEKQKVLNEKNAAEIIHQLLGALQHIHS